MASGSSKIRKQFPISARRILKTTIDISLPWFLPLFLLFLFGVSIFAVLAVTVLDQSLTSRYFAILGIIALAFPCFVLFNILVTIIYQMLVFDSHFYDLTPDYLIIKKGVIGRGELIVPFDHIKDIYLSQDYFGKKFGLYNLFILLETSQQSDIRIEGFTKQRAEELRAQISQLVKQKKVLPLQPTGGASQNTQQATHELITERMFPIQSTWVIKQTIIAVFLSIFFLGPLFYPYYYYISNLSDSLRQLLLVLYFVIALFIVVFIFLKAFFNKSQIHYTIGDSFILIKRGVFTKQQIYAPYKSIQNVTVKRDIIDTILGSASVSLDTVEHTTKEEVAFEQNQPNANAVQTRSDVYIIDSNNKHSGIPGLKIADAEKIKDTIVQKLSFIV